VPLTRRMLNRTLLMRGTIHLVTPADAHGLRGFVQPYLDKVSRSNQLSRPAHVVPRTDFEAAVHDLLAGSPVPVTVLGESLAARFPEAPAAALANRARETLPLVQLPPRGLCGGPAASSTSTSPPGPARGRRTNRGWWRGATSLRSGRRCLRPDRTPGRDG